MFKLMNQKIFAILRKLFLLNWPYDYTLATLIAHGGQIRDQSNRVEGTSVLEFRR